MSLTLPFHAWLPEPDYASQVAARSAGYVNDQEILGILGENPLSYLHAVKPYLHFGTDKKNPELHFAHGANYIKQMIASNVLLKSKEESYYLYRQTSIDTGIYYQGVIGLCRNEAYVDNKIKVHEHTLTKKENLLIDHIHYTKMAGEPVLLMHESCHDLDVIKRDLSLQEPIIKFNMEGLVHEIWQITGIEMQHMHEALGQIQLMYIADGHHRTSAASRYILSERANTKGFMSLFIDKADLHIEPFHRLIKTNTKGLLEFLTSNNFNVSEVNSFHELKSDLRCFGFYFNNDWYQIEYTGVYFEEGTLDISIIEEAFVNDFCSIADSKTDDRVEFFAGSKPIYLAEEQVNGGEYDLLITLNPCTIDNICEIADKGKTMPPKSTFVFPKLLTGLTIQEF